jgi:hypothetical protein
MFCSVLREIHGLGDSIHGAMCGSSTNVKERPGQKVAESHKRAQFRRVEIWLVPAGADMPAGMTTMKTFPEKDLEAKGYPR